LEFAIVPGLLRKCEDDPGYYHHFECYMGVPDVAHHIGKEFIILSYFILTTLSTVGFGDFAPRSNMER
jgi:hypothetical protein